jgi:hypothetical protein
LTGPQQATVPGGVYTLHFGGDHASTLNLPMLPLKAFPEVPAGVRQLPWTENTRSVGGPDVGEDALAAAGSEVSYRGG